MPAKRYTLCACGHRDEAHQSLNPNTVLVSGQQPCYGSHNSDCTCDGWRPTIRVTHYGVFNNLPFQEAVNVTYRKGWWYEWV